VEIAGRVALVTGAGAGIGRATALRLAREGAVVGVADFDDGAGRETVGEIEAASGRAGFVHVDIRPEPSCRWTDYSPPGSSDMGHPHKKRKPQPNT